MPCEAFFTTLDRYKGQIPLTDIMAWLEATDITFADVSGYLRFHPNHYVRNLIHSGPGYQTLVLCWRSGQRSPIHDHTGSTCGVKIIRGVATETVFEFAANEMIYPTTSRFLEEGAICGSEDSDMHQVSNLQPGADLVTLHIYSPPLLSMNTYSLVNRSVSRFVDPVNMEFVGGAGI